MQNEVQPFRAMEISSLARRLAAEGRSILHMEFGQPSMGAPQKAIDVARASLDEGAMGYWESPVLKERLAALYAERYGVSASPSQFLLTCGASPALVLALTICFKAGAAIAMARPGYVAYRNAVRALNMVPVEIPCGAESRFQMTADALDALDPPPAGVIIASPANPTGTVIGAEELRAIADVCRRKGIRILSDEIYHGLSYGEPCRSMAEFSPDAMIISSFSKYYCMPGWRLGWLMVPTDLIERAWSYMGALFLTPPTISQQAAVAAMDCTDELDANVAVYAQNRGRLLEALPRMGLRRIAPPDGAFYIYADIGHLTDNSMEFCRQLLLETGLATGPGIDHDPVDGRHFLRLSFAISLAETEEALGRLETWLAGKGR
ncbi:MAG: aminotransferase class I/II-fold pyridoxal phosphate-dependent enzyme [Pseudomonadota bacterium]